ncbi:thiamine-phosphate kinase [Lyngbya sp. PCC 8106]|uniref:thiamine-phosphate kinase n=1 Tax=Lyngbya sp. (strain PCC 8106) TaxID=313612 RepID=UPI0000EAA44F|nr:thiamine-phosphate kinase [Lyngbya sp. PCC 8106]EAW34440.1 thiamine monophosphate kinase [Lyngbya sp. PCC 8106]
MNIQDIGEQGLLAIVKRFCPQEVVGDDGAILTPKPDQSLVITTDMLVDEVHFSDRTTTASDVGWRATAANLSDIAAMGAFPVGITVALGLTPETSVEWVEEFYQGISQCLEPFNTPIVGGDICQSRVRCVSITAFGQVNPQFAIRRNTALAGNAIVVTGVHGDSRAGLEVLLKPECGQSLSQMQRSSLIQAHQRPLPRLDAIAILQEILPDEVRVAGMDSSDGLADAVVQICQASQVGARIERHQIPLSKALQQLVSPSEAINWALYGGEDFQLVLCLPLSWAEQFVEKLGTGAAVVGITTTNPQILLVDQTQPQTETPLVLNKGFKHF